MVQPAQPTYTRGQSYIDQLLAALRMGMSPPQLPGQGGVQRALEGYMNEPVPRPGPGPLAPSPGLDPFGGGGPPAGQSGIGPLGGPPPALGGAVGSDYAPSLGLPPVGAPPPGGGLSPVQPGSAGLPAVASTPGLPATGGGGFPDESARAGIRAGLGPAATGQPPPGGLGGPLATSGLGGADLSPDVADAIYADPSLALRNQFREAGLSPDNNPYVRMAMARLQPVVAALADFQGIINAGNVAGAAGDELKTVLPGLISGLVSGKLNGRQILDQILGMADDDEIKTFLAEMGAPRLLELQGNLSGTSARRQQARARYQGNKIADIAARQQAEAGRNKDVDEREWLKIVRGR